MRKSGSGGGNVIETSGDVMNYAAAFQNPAMLMISLIKMRGHY